MACIVRGGPRIFDVERDKEGHRTYTISHLVEGSSGVDGPYNALHAAGLPLIGSYWDFLEDVDPWAFCTPEARVKIHQCREGSKTAWFIVEQVFSTKPLSRCQDEEIEDPLLEPQKVSGTFIKYMEDATEDRYGDPIKTVSHETITQGLAFDANRPTVHIEQNVAVLELALFSQMVDTLNEDTLWGLAARKIKLSNVSWERLMWGTCEFYYKRAFDFDIRFDGWDRDVAPMCTKALGHWNTLYSEDAYWILEGNVDDPADFKRFFCKGVKATAAAGSLDAVERQMGQPAKCILNADGSPWEGEGDEPIIHVEKYDESDFTLLGIPMSF